MKNVKIVLILCFGFFLVGCEEDEDNAAAVAQKCLNQITTSVEADAQAQADACLAAIGTSSTNQRILRVRCALKFISDGVTQAEMISGFQQLNTNQAASSPVLAVSSIIGFSSTAAADEIIDICEQAQSSTLVMIANLGKIGALCGSPVLATCEGNLSAIPPGATLDELGEVAQSVYSLYCGPDKADDSVCKSIETAAIPCGGMATATTSCLATEYQACMELPNCGT